jgi:hypothetical protein
MFFEAKPLSPKDEISWSRLRSRGAAAFIAAFSVLLAAGTCLVRALMSMRVHDSAHLTTSYLAQTFSGGLIAGVMISGCLWWRFERRYRARRAKDSSIT